VKVWTTMESSGQAHTSTDRHFRKADLFSRLGRSAWIHWVLMIVTFFLADRAHAESVIVFSLKPIHSLVRSVMHGVGEPVLLVTELASGEPRG